PTLTTITSLTTLTSITSLTSFAYLTSPASFASMRSALARIGLIFNCGQLLGWCASPRKDGQRTYGVIHDPG
ncbi:MAG: hypothetical protein ABIY71_11025, partial [Flavobacteriales bacterium]